MQSLRNRAGLPRCAIVAMGVSGCGKSTLVAHLAAYLSCPALEGDDFHAAASIAKMRTGQPLDDADRWPWLDRLGAAIGSTVREDGMALAACSALKRSYRDYLVKEAGEPVLFVFLEGTQEVIASRMAARVHEYMPASLLASQFATLEVPEADENAVAIPITLTVEQIAERAVKAVPHLKAFKRKQ